jgi:hypothetical protein
LVSASATEWRLVRVERLNQGVEYPEGTSDVEEHVHANAEVTLLEAPDGLPGDTSTLRDLFRCESLQLPPGAHLLAQVTGRLPRSKRNWSCHLNHLKLRYQ